MAQNRFADLGNVATGGEIHDGVGAEVDRHVQLVQLFVDIGGDRGVADVGVDLAPGGDANPHGLQLGVVDVGRNDEPAGGDLVADQADGNLFAFGDKGHLLGDLPLTREVHLGHVGVAGACRFEFALYDPLSPRLQDLIACRFRCCSLSNRLTRNYTFRCGA